MKIFTTFTAAILAITMASTMVTVSYAKDNTKSEAIVKKVTKNAGAKKNISKPVKRNIKDSKKKNTGTS